MRRRLFGVATGLVTAGVLVASASADGLPRRYSADAFFTTTSGCVDTFVGVFPVAAKDRGTGGAEGASINVQVEQFDTCSNAFVLRATGFRFLAPGEFEMSEGLNKASLDLSIVVTDAVSGRVFPLSIELGYERTGPRSACTEFAGGGEVTTFCSGAVEGVVSDGVTSYTPGPGDAVFQEHRPV
jgi:hypothetical protein